MILGRVATRLMEMTLAIIESLSLLFAIHRFAATSFALACPHVRDYMYIHGLILLNSSPVYSTPTQSSVDGFQGYLDASNEAPKERYQQFQRNMVKIF